METTSKQRKNLVNLAKRTPEEREEIARKGGIKSGEAKREKKLMSQILSDYLQKEHDIILRDDKGNEIKREKVSAEDLVNRTITAVMNRGDAASASMIKTLGELTEGNKMTLAGKDGGPVEVSVIKRVIVDNQGKSN